MAAVDLTPFLRLAESLSDRIADLEEKDQVGLMRSHLIIASEFPRWKTRAASALAGGRELETAAHSVGVGLRGICDRLGDQLERLGLSADELDAGREVTGMSFTEAEEEVTEAGEEA